MSEFSDEIRRMFAAGDKKRDEGVSEPEGVTKKIDIPYKAGDIYNLFDIYYPQKKDSELLPVILNIHGGAYVYGNKEVYRYYGMNMAKQGFVFMNPNYHLAPEYNFPIQLGEINDMLLWIQRNGENYGLDIHNIFLVGDSAGAQLASHYAAIYSNPAFLSFYGFQLPEMITIRAIALNCGMYDLKNMFLESIKDNESLDTKALLNDYLGMKKVPAEMLDVYAAVTDKYPPTYIMTAEYDFLQTHAYPFFELLKNQGAYAEFKKYGQPGQEWMTHVFHCNMKLQEAMDCNKAECEFLRRFMDEGK